ncbi:hypothetical protein I3843_01G257400 [Carya illinoinensis]|uniref:Histone H2A n=1 Tax=Carya illinoinensis TaxID=32201 RepID=A0A922K8R5_CARIL|nr:probable histone H2A.5 [Carya illinoinensis]KAG2729718.1 hypothetical protein I3760_01G262400 [Carya illinoinensis]KAG6734315.1 hypothetical protein I3842_01G266800 [Carya illinoinensis]KAG7998412.1 hypothetical protein I3843_01G257400 [Carya illinoinensis]
MPKKQSSSLRSFEYLAIEVLELARSAARDNKKNRINPRHVFLAVRNDEELGKLLQGVNDSPLSKVKFYQTSTEYCLPKKTTTSESKKVSKLQLELLCLYPPLAEKPF